MYTYVLRNIAAFINYGNDDRSTIATVGALARICYLVNEVVVINRVSKDVHRNRVMGTVIIRRLRDGIHSHRSITNESFEMLLRLILGVRLCRPASSNGASGGGPLRSCRSYSRGFLSLGYRWVDHFLLCGG